MRAPLLSGAMKNGTSNSIVSLRLLLSSREMITHQGDPILSFKDMSPITKEKHSSRSEIASLVLKSFLSGAPIKAEKLLTVGCKFIPVRIFRFEKGC